MKVSNDWPLGLCRDLALISEESVAELGLPFWRDEDDLDSFDFVVISHRDRNFALRLRDNQPASGYVLIGMDDGRSVCDEIDAFLDMTKLAEGSVIWMATDLAD